MAIHLLAYFKPKMAMSDETKEKPIEEQDEINDHSETDGHGSELMEEHERDESVEEPDEVSILKAKIAEL
jgi:hypothetical protein